MIIPISVILKCSSARHMSIKSEFSMLKNNVLDILDNPKYIVQISQCTIWVIFTCTKSKQLLELGVKFQFDNYWSFSKVVCLTRASSTTVSKRANQIFPQKGQTKSFLKKGKSNLFTWSAKLFPLSRLFTLIEYSCRQHGRTK